eukprot:4891253-Prymnesium_polylepis.1
MVHVVSYGTYLAQRFLQLFPDAADAVLLDSVCAPDLIRLPWASLANRQHDGLGAPARVRPLGRVPPQAAGPRPTVAGEPSLRAPSRGRASLRLPPRGASRRAARAVGPLGLATRRGPLGFSSG